MFNHWIYFIRPSGTGRGREPDGCWAVAEFVGQTFRVSPDHTLLSRPFTTSVSRIPVDPSLAYPFVTYITPLMMTIFNQFMSFDVIPSHDQPYGYSMGPQATNRAMAPHATSTATAKEQNDNWAPFVVVVLCALFTELICVYIR